MAVALLGIASGLPLALTASTLFAWLKQSGIDKSSIGLFAMVALPYSFKFIWAPFVDNLKIPVLYKLIGRRRSWILISEIFLAASIFAMAFLNPETDASLMAAAAVAIAFFSATHDIVIDAYRVEILKEEQYGAGAAAITFGYRIGMLISGAGALWFAEDFSWGISYIIMSALVFIGFFACIIGGEPILAIKTTESPNKGVIARLKSAVIEPFKEFLTREKNWVLVLLFIISFKMCDAFIGTMMNPFLIEIGFSLKEIAGVAKTFGLFATLTGAFLGGLFIAKYGAIRCLWVAGVLQILSNLIFVAQYHAGNDINFLYVTMAVENLCGGFGTAAFVAFISALCNVQFTATQYALLSSLASVGRTFLSSLSGYSAEHMGWEMFFIASMSFGIPALVLLKLLSRKPKPS